MAATTISRVGFGQVEPNHLSAQRTSQIYAQLPADDSINILENGQFVKYDYAAGKVDFAGKGEWMMVFNEVKLYDDWRESYKDFAMIKENYVDKVMVPRVIKTNVGDIYTTNCVGGANTSGKAIYAGIELDKGNILKVDTKGYLVKGEETDEGLLWQVVKVYTMADGQPAVKLQRIK